MIGYNRHQVSSGALVMLGLAIGAGITAAGWLVGNAVRESTVTGRHVTVQGVAERVVEADRATWPIAYLNEAGDRVALQQQIDADFAVILEFLAQFGFDEDQLHRAAPRITETIRDEDGTANVSFQSESILRLHTDQVGPIRQAMSASGALVAGGVALIQSDDLPVEYDFSSLAAIRSELIAEATINARLTADEFARDSGSLVGAVQQASQDPILVSDRDRHSPDFKRIRVTTTVRFDLSPQADES